MDAVRDAVPLVGGDFARDDDARRDRGARLSHSSRSRCAAVYPVYGRIRNMTMAAGRWLGPEDEAEKQRVAVMGGEAARKMFGEIPPEGEEIAINGLRFTVIGVLKTKTQISNYNTPDNECIFIPYETGSLLRDIKYPDYIVWMPANPMFREEAVRQVRETLARVHNFSASDERAVADYRVQRVHAHRGHHGNGAANPAGIHWHAHAGDRRRGPGQYHAGVGTQRTREIGVLKSIGATRRSILMQFLLEAMAIVTVGGVAGRGVRLRRDRHAADAAAAGAAIQGHQRHRRHPFADFAIRGDDVDAAAGDCGADCGAAAGDQGIAHGPDRSAKVRVSVSRATTEGCA